MQKEKPVEDIFLKSLGDDLNCFSEAALEYLKAECHSKKEPRLSAKFHVVIHTSFGGTPQGKGVITSLEYYAPALSAYACFKSSKDASAADGAQYLFDAGIDYFHEWHDRKKSVLAYLAHMRTNANESVQLKIINEKIKSPDVTGYALDRNSIAPKKTADSVIKLLKKYLNWD